MQKVKIVIALLLVGTVLMAGCLGGDDENSNSDGIQYIEAKGSAGTEGDVEANAQASPESVTKTVDLPIPSDNITKVSFVITVEDGESDSQTEPDEVSGSLDGSGEGGYNETLQQGNTPYRTTVEIKAPEGLSLPSGWTITLDVVCHSSNDQWPGPMIWRGYADNGFSYNVSVEYTYLTPMT